MALSIDFKKKLYDLSNNWLEDGTDENCYSVEGFGELKFFQISGITDALIEDEKIDIGTYTSILTGASIEDLEIQYIVLGNNGNVSIFVGVNQGYFDIVKSSYRSAFPGIEMEDISSVRVDRRLSKLNVGGTVIGYPSVGDISKGRVEAPQINKIIRGMYGENWAVVISAKAAFSQAAYDLVQATQEEIGEIAPHVRKSVSGQGVAENESYEVVDYDAAAYQERLKLFLERLMNFVTNGVWRTGCVLLSDSENCCQKLLRLFKGAYGGKDSEPYLLKTAMFDNIGNYLSSRRGLITEKLDRNNLNFLMEGCSYTDEPFNYYSYKFQTPMSSVELAQYFALPTIEQPGFYINQALAFDCAPRREMDEELEMGSIVVNGAENNRITYGVELNSLTKHCLINGITGGGKSNTSKYLLTTLIEDCKIPFLVIESAKQEYYELGRVLPSRHNDLQVFTLGYEGKDSVGYRINPFERIGNVSLQLHIDYLLASFKASFKMEPPMPYVLESAVYGVYEDYGWDVIHDRNIKGRTDYPTLEDLYYRVEIVADEYGYTGELRSNIITALRARISSLRIGGKGAMLDVKKSYPVDVLLSAPTVLELDAIGDDEVKAFVISSIMVQLYEYRKSSMNNVTKKGLQHVLLIEEAHRLLKNVAASGGDAGGAQAKAVEFFCNMLAEIRSYGQGIIIADQMPTKLAPDVLKNTNIKICHRIVTKEDRELLGSAMNMNSEQIEAISMFRTGYAAMYSEGDSRPALVKLPLVKDLNSKTRQEILNNSRALTAKHLPSSVNKKGCGLACSVCPKCVYQEKLKTMFDDGTIDDAAMKSFIEQAKKYPYLTAKTLTGVVAHFEKKYIKRSLLAGEKLCLLYHLERYFIVPDAYLRRALFDYAQQEGIK